MEDRMGKRDYSPFGPDAKRAVESGLTAAEWYHTEVPRKVMKDLMARKHIFLERPIAAEVLQYCGADVLYLLRMHSLWQHSLPSERIIAKSMDRLSQFYTRSSEIPARKMAEIDFARC